MADVTLRVAEGKFPTEPYAGEYWEESEYHGDTLLSGPSTRWIVWFTHNGTPMALRLAGPALVLTPKGIRGRWGGDVLQDLHQAAHDYLEQEPDEYDSWVTALERSWEAQNGK